MYSKTGGDERMKKMKLIMAATAILSLTASPAVFADSFAPGEGMYVGAFVGHAAGHVSAKITTNEVASSSSFTKAANSVEFTDGGIAINGIEGGLWAGYGYKMGDLYAGIETDFAGGGGKFGIKSSTAIDLGSNNNDGGTSLTEITAEMAWNGGASARVGYYVNPDTLFSVKGGFSAAKFNTKFAGANESFYAGGPRVGTAIESRISAIDPNLTVKLSANYVDYLSARLASFGNNESDSTNSSSAEVTGAAYNFRLGVQYSFFDVNSLF